MSNRSTIPALASFLLFMLCSSSIADRMPSLLSADPATPEISPKQSAGDEPAGMPKVQQKKKRIGVVDLTRVSREYKAKQDLQARLDTMKRRNEERETTIRDTQLLTRVEYDELDALLRRSDSKPETAARLDSLKSKSRDLCAEFENLSMKDKAELSAAQAARLKELNTLDRVREDKLESVKRRDNDEVDRFVRIESERVISAVRSAIRKIAHDLDCDHVEFKDEVTERDRSHLEDITSAVIIYLQKQSLPKHRLHISRPEVGYRTVIGFMDPNVRISLSSRASGVPTHFLTIKLNYAWETKPDSTVILSWGSLDAEGGGEWILDGSRIVRDVSLPNKTGSITLLLENPEWRLKKKSMRIRLERAPVPEAHVICSNELIARIPEGKR